MKDRQVEPTPSHPRIPILSAVLHWVSMSVVVYFRSGFGFAYLRPKSVFLATIWAFTLFSIYAWNEPAVWKQHASLACFGMMASVLYLLHLMASVWSEARGNATHDHDSGIPHSFRLLRIAGSQPSAKARAAWLIWGEPFLVLLAALAAGWVPNAKSLSTWLLISAVCLWLKEALNLWFQIRQRKRHRDAIQDAEDGLDASHITGDTPPVATGRKDKVMRKRSH